MSKKKLPDHRVRVDTTQIEFSTDHIEQLQVKYKFNKLYPLAKKLDHVAMFFEKKEYYDPPPKLSEQKKLLSAMIQSEAVLIKAMKQLGPTELSLIRKNETGWNRQEKIKVISKIMHPVRTASHDLPAKNPGGRPRMDNQRKLIMNLLKIYQDGTGRNDRYSQDWDTSKYSGGLIDFIEEISSHLNVPISNQFIGDELKNIFSAKS